MAKGRKAKQAKTKLNMIIYGDTFTAVLMYNKKNGGDSYGKTKKI